MSRIKLHGKHRIRVGDVTTHGGVVVTGSATLKEDGVPIARKGDTVTCPLCEPHIFVIAEGLESCLDQGIPIATEGHKTTCGAQLISRS
ncbi:MAG: PAAR domain-containing protein [Zoogloeaceae bacterium]|nr:PAAR domain-containing protein [Zoogloeaceae bacterium]